MCKRYGVNENAIHLSKSIEINENGQHHDHDPTWCRDPNHDYCFNYFSFIGDGVDDNAIHSLKSIEIDEDGQHHV